MLIHSADFFVSPIIKRSFAGRPNITAAWSSLIAENNLTAFLYPVSLVETA